jgi:predicted aconitase with swiveling domain
VGNDVSGRVLVAGSARGEAVVLEQPLSLWGGIDPETGTVIDRRHPQAGARLVGRVVVMPFGRGSSSSSTVLAESIRLGTAPAAVVLLEPDPILALGATVAQELYGRSLPIVVVSPDDYGRIRTGDTVTVDAGAGRVDPLVWAVRLTGEPG